MRFLTIGETLRLLRFPEMSYAKSKDLFVTKKGDTV